MSTDGRARRGVPADRRLHRSGQRHPGARQGRAVARHADPRGDRGRRRSPSTGGGSPRVHTDRGEHRAARWSSTRPACGASRSAGMAGARVPAFAVEHQYVLTGPIDGHARDGHADDARPGSPRVLQARRAGPAGRRLRAGHVRVRRGRHPGAVPTAAARAEPRSLRAARRARREAHAGDRAGRHPHA